MRRKLLVLLAVPVLLVVVVLSFVLPGHQNQQTDEETPATDINQSQVVHLTNISSYQAQLIAPSLNTIQQTLYQRTAETTDQAAASYDGTIRSGSFEVHFYTRDSVRVPLVEFLVDIPAANRTFRVHQFGGDDYPMSILYVLCPTSGELNYGAFTCVNNGQ